jgi:hypothetical protein
MKTSGQLSKLYKSLTGRGALPLEPDDPFYVPILASKPETDPILAILQRINLAESESVHLLTGFRGNGKSTELLRLKSMLVKDGCQVFLVNMLDYVLMTKPLALSDFILSLMAALAGAVEKSSPKKLAPLSRSYWERLHDFLSSEVVPEKIDLDIKGPGGAAKFGLKLKTDPKFKTRIQKHLEGHLTRLVQDAREFIDELVVNIRKQTKDPDKKVVLLVDSLEQLRGVGENAATIYASVVELFFGQSANLSFPKLHILYTVPPYLTALVPNLGRSLGEHPVTQWPNIHVRARNNTPDPEGLGVMEKIIDKRFYDWDTIIPKHLLHKLVEASGGDLRDFFRLVREAVLSLRTIRWTQPDAQMDESIVKRVIQHLRNELLPIAKEDAQWLAKIHASKQASLQTDKDLPDLARFLDSNRIMNYLNGEPWYDVHPLLIEEITRIDVQEENQEA